MTRLALTVDEALPSLRRLSAVADDLGFPSSPALRKWCARHSVTVYKVGAVNFVDPGEIRRLILGSAGARTVARNDDESELTEALRGPANVRARR